MGREHKVLKTTGNSQMSAGLENTRMLKYDEYYSIKGRTKNEFTHIKLLNREVRKLVAVLTKKNTEKTSPPKADRAV